jgi:hypothetical protein
VRGSQITFLSRGKCRISLTQLVKRPTTNLTHWGGEFQSVLSKLRELKEVDPRWDWDVLLDENQVVTALWWQSPTQADLCRRFYDALINDNTYCRNQYGYLLNIGGSLLWNITFTDTYFRPARDCH